MIWSEERVKNLTRKLVAISGGRLRYSEEERVVSGEFPIAANMGGAVEQMWQWQAKGAPHGGYRLNARAAFVFSIGRAEKLCPSQSGEAFRWFYGHERSPRHSR